MSIVEQQILSKALDEGSVHELLKYNVTEKDFFTLPQAFNFIKTYVEENDSTPDYRTVVAEFDNFEYLPDVSDSFKYLSKKLKSATARREAVNILQYQAGEKFNKLTGSEFADWLLQEATHLKELSSADSYSGTNYATTGKERWEMYEDSKENRTHKFIPTPYPSLTEYLGGGFELGDYVLLQAYTNRGKSWIGSHIGVKAWAENFGVLHYSPELSEAQQVQRNDTLLGHFNNVGLKTGSLQNEQAYKDFLEQDFSGENETPYIIKTMEHLPKGLGLDVISADLQANPDIKMVIIDGFNLMSHKGTGGNRDNMSNTSRKLRQLFSRFGVVGLVIHQTPTSAEKDNKAEDDTGARIVKPAEVHQYSETIAVIQDAVTILSFDQSDGLGKILLSKTRSPHVGAEITLHCDFNHGYITERTILDDI